MNKNREKNKFMKKSEKNNKNMNKKKFCAKLKRVFILNATTTTTTATARTTRI